MDSFELSRFRLDSWTVWMDNFMAKKDNKNNGLYTTIYKLSNYPTHYINT